MANVASTEFSPLHPVYGESSAEARKAKPDPLGKSGKNKKTGETKKKFGSLFEKAVLETVKEFPQSEDSLHELLDEINSSGDALAKRPFLEEIAAYRAAVRNFVNYVVKNSFDTEEQTSRPRVRTQADGVEVRDQKKFTIIRIIDSKLEGMAAAILRGQKNQLEILEKLDEIKGLLVDLME